VAVAVVINLHRMVEGKAVLEAVVLEAHAMIQMIQ